MINWLDNINDESIHKSWMFQCEVWIKQNKALKHIFFD